MTLEKFRHSRNPRAASSLFRPELAESTTPVEDETSSRGDPTRKRRVVSLLAPITAEPDLAPDQTGDNVPAL
jgi:hypothetical protein